MLVRVKPPVGELNEVLDLVKKTENNPLSKAGCDYFATREKNPRCGFCLRCLWPPIWNNGQTHCSVPEEGNWSERFSTSLRRIGIKKLFGFVLPGQPCVLLIQWP